MVLKTAQATQFVASAKSDDAIKRQVFTNLTKAEARASFELSGVSASRPPSIS